MKKLLLPVILALVGLVGGAAAGWFLKPPPPPEPCRDAEGRELDAEACAAMKAEEAAKEAEENPPSDDAQYPSPSEFVPLERQLVIPVMGEDGVSAFVLLSLTIEIDPGTGDSVLSREPRLRDSFLRVLFDHAYAGGFDGAFTAHYVMEELRRKLLAAARRGVGPSVRNVLISDIVRQDQ